MDVSNLNTTQELNELLDSLDTLPTELFINKEMDDAIADLRISSHPVGNDIRFRGIHCTLARRP
jgi:hypothetical protein